MEIRPLHGWDVDPAAAREIQLELRERVVAHPPEGFAASTVGGADLLVARGRRGPGLAAVVVLRADGLEETEAATASVTVDFPYVPGLLSFRELPALARAWERISAPPDVLIFDGHGYAHPRRFGLACHGGLLFDVPSIGCAKSLLVGEHASLAPDRGARAEIVHEGETVGAAVRTRTDVRPVYVSVGHLMDLETAVELVLAVSPRYRIPEPVRRADRLVGRMRREE